jgi:hypothetical protein
MVDDVCSGCNLENDENGEFNAIVIWVYMVASQAHKIPWIFVELPCKSRYYGTPMICDRCHLSGYIPLLNIPSWVWIKIINTPPKWMLSSPNPSAPNTLNSKVFRFQKPTPNTVSEGVWSCRDRYIMIYHDISYTAMWLSFGAVGQDHQLFLGDTDLLRPSRKRSKASRNNWPRPAGP